MHTLDLNRYTSPRLNPSQLRGKERIRVILAAALTCFREMGIDQATTNDIAEAAGVPIGSVYRYFENKEEIILALTDLYVTDVITLFKEIAENTLLPQLNWQELFTLITDIWAHHTQINHSLTFIYFFRCNLELAGKIQKRWVEVGAAFLSILQQRDTTITKQEGSVYIQLIWSAVEISVRQGDELAHEATRIIAASLDQRAAQQTSSN